MTTDVDIPTAAVVVALHLSPARGIPMKAVTSATVEAGKGFIGDRYHGSKHRHVSIQAVEALKEAADALGAPIGDHQTRRNVTISGLDVPTTPGERLRVGPVELEVVRIAAPCKLLDDDIGRGAKTALRRRAGTIFRTLSSGTISVGDPVSLVG